MAKRLNTTGIDDSPRLKSWLASEDTLYFIVKDLEGVKSLKIQDMNNSGKEILSFSNLEQGESLITVDTKKFKSVKDLFKLKIVAEENDSNYAQKSTQTISFKLSHEKIEIPPQVVKLDRTVLLLDKAHYNVATLEAKIEPTLVTTNRTISWKSSNTNVATVNSKGEIKAVSEGTTTITARTANGKEAKCTLTVFGQMKKVEQGTPGAVAGKINVGGYWLVKKVKWSKEQVESYINNAEKLCQTGNYDKYPEAAPNNALPIFKATSQYTTADGKYGVVGKTEYINKSKGISANNYLLLATTTNQMVYMFEKIDGKWTLIHEENTSTGSVNNGGHNRFDFYIGAMYRSYYGIEAIFQFWQCRQGGYCIEGTGGTYDGNLKQPYYAHRGFHPGYIDSIGTPSSAGCIHISQELKGKIYKNEKMYGTRLIVY